MADSSTPTSSHGNLFTHFKQWVSFYREKDAKSKIGQFFERISGGEVQYSMAEAAQANSRGMVYRSTRFRISELTLETQLNADDYKAFSEAFNTFMHDGNDTFEVRRMLKGGKGQSLTYYYKRCSVIQPPLPDDGDVGRDSEFLMMRIRLQPEALWVGDNGSLQKFDPTDALLDKYFTGDEAGTAASK